MTNTPFPDAERLRRDLEEVVGEAPEPSPELRAAVLEHAREPRRRRIDWRPAAAILSAAAVLTLLLVRPGADRPEVLEESVARQERVAAEPMAVAERKAAADVQPGDLNGDGRVDILDAWQLAHGADDPGRDARVSPDELGRLMQRIVAVGGGAS